MLKDEDAQASNLNLSDCSVLMVVGQLQPMNSRHLSAIMDINPGTISLYVQRLVEKGLLDRQRDLEDRRTWWLTLTEQGKGEYEKIIRKTVEYTADFFSPLNESELAAFFEMALRVAHHLGFQWE